MITSSAAWVYGYDRDNARFPLAHTPSTVLPLLQLVHHHHRHHRFPIYYLSIRIEMLVGDIKSILSLPLLLSPSNVAVIVTTYGLGREARRGCIFC